MRAFDLGWVAGILEGEGCFYTKVVKNGESFSLATRIIVSMTDKDVLIRFQHLCGGWIGGPYLPRKSVRQVWSWNLWGANAVALMKKVRPYMGERRSRKIDEAVAAHAASVERRQALNRIKGLHMAKVVNGRRAASRGFPCLNFL